MKGKMREWLVKGKVRQMKAAEAVKEFASGEKGASHLVEIIVVIVIVIAIAGVFHEQLEKAVEAIFTNLTGFINGSEHGGV